MTSHENRPTELQHYDDTEIRRNGPRTGTRVIAFIIAAVMVLSAISVAVGIALTSRGNDRPTIDTAPAQHTIFDVNER